MRTRGRGWVLVAAVCGLAAACTSTSTPVVQPIEWAQQADRYFRAFHEAQGVGFTNLAPFYTPDARVDNGLLDHDGIGRPQAIQAMRDSAQSPPVSFGGRDPTDATSIAFDEPLYVSRDGAVDVARITPVEYIIPMASSYRLGPAGIESESWTGSLAAAEEYVGLDRAPYQRIAADYVHAWAAGDSDAVAQLYDADARLDDSLTGLSLRGRDRIGDAARRPWPDGGLTGAALREIPAAGGPAIYLNGHSTGGVPIDRMVLLVHVDEADGCPGDVAVVLNLDGSTILAEERYHRVDSPVRCWQSPPSGWWDDMPIPDPHSVIRTGTMTINGLDISIWNGTPDPRPLLMWGLQRFADAGLPAPIPTSVTFLPSGEDPWLDHGFEEGTTAPDLAIPLPASDACSDASCTEWPTPAKAAVLHQLAHLYLADPTFPRWEDPAIGPNRTQPFRATHDLIWLDPSRPWAEQAAQLAAETVAWGLMHEPYAVDARMGSPSCAHLAEDFVQLTGSAPDPRSCPQGDPDVPSGASPSAAEPATPHPTGTSAPGGPAAAAERWFDAHDAALDRGILDLYGFYSPEASFDHRALGMDVTSGRDTLREHLTTMAGAPLLQRDPIEPLHVSRTGAVSVMALAGSARAAFMMSLAATGITSETYAPSLVTLRSRHPSDERLTSLQRFAHAYVAAWAGRDATAVSDLYAPEASLTDELLDLSVTGSDEVGALARAATDRGGLPDAGLVGLPDLGGPAVFATGNADPGDPLDTVVLLLSTVGDCPTHVAIVLRLDAEGRIAGEARHHGATDVGGCSVPRPPTTPWWEGLAIPPGVSVADSGTLTVDDRTIEVRNSSPALDGLLRWGLGRFTEAGVHPPAVESVTFVDRTAPACTGINGLAAGGQVSLCFGTSDACTDDGCTGWRAWAKKAVLHELSHVWMTQNVTSESQSTFLRASGLPTWESADLPWGERGVELAAETISGALMDEPITPNVKLGRRYTCAELATLYAALAGRPPTNPPCVD